MREILEGLNREVKTPNGRLYVSLASRPGVEKTWGWLERLLKDEDFLDDLFSQIEERPFVMFHRNVYSEQRYPEGELDQSKTHIFLSIAPI